GTDRKACSASVGHRRRGGDRLARSRAGRPEELLERLDVGAGALLLGFDGGELVGPDPRALAAHPAAEGLLALAVDAGVVDGAPRLLVVLLGPARMLGERLEEVADALHVGLHPGDHLRPVARGA